MSGLSQARRIGYGVAELGSSGAEVMLRVSLLIFYTQIVGLSPKMASYAIALAVLWDAVSDPLMGRISDRISLGGQRRRPFFLPGALGLAACLVLLFNVPDLQTQWSKFLYLLVCYVGTNTFLTILSVPHTALAADISQSEDLRLSLFGWRLIFANIGLMLGTLVPALVVLLGVSTLAPDALGAMVMAVLIVASVLVSLYATRGLDAAKHTASASTAGSLKRDIAHVLNDRSFVQLLFAYMVATIGLTLNSSLALYYYQFRLALDDVSVRGIIAFFMLVFCLAIPLWVYVARRVSKKAIIVVNVGALALMTIVGYPLFPAGDLLWPYLAGLFGGVFVGAVVLMDVAVADMADAQARKRQVDDTHHGTYFGLWKMGSKVSRAAALVLTGNALAWIGFHPGQTPDADTAHALALLFGPGVGIFLLLSVLIVAATRVEQPAS